MKFERDDVKLAALLVFQLELEPGPATALVSELREIAGKLHKLYERAGDRELTQAEERRQASLEERAASLGKGFKVRVHFNGDPRGFPVRLVWAKDGARQESNNWGGEDWGM